MKNVESRLTRLERTLDATEPETKTTIVSLPPRGEEYTAHRNQAAKTLREARAAGDKIVVFKNIITIVDILPPEGINDGS